MAITRVQSTTAMSNSASTLAVTFSSSPTAGNLIVIVAGTNNSPMYIDNSSTLSWAQVFRTGASGTYMTIFIGKVFTGASATSTITMVGTSPIAAVAAEYSGVTNALDRGSIATNTGTSAASGATGTTSAANELWIGGIVHRNTNGATFSAPTNSFSIVGQTNTTSGTVNDRSACLLERIVSSTGTADAGATISASGVWIAQALTFPEPTAGGSGLIGRLVDSNNLVA